MKKIFALCFLIFMTIILSSCDYLKIENNKGVIINEICTNNGSALATVDYDYIDWIELYNTTEKDIFLKNYGISDDKNDLYKYTFPSVYIKANSYLIVFFDKDDNSNEQLFANFGLSSSGEVIYLTMPNGSVIEEIVVPSLTLNTSYGRYNIDGSTTFKILNPSPNQKNEDKPIYRYISNPSFSVDSGFYDDNFELILSTDEDVDIYYTLDCSEPTKDSNLYTNAIKVTDPSDSDNVLKSRQDMSIFENKNTNPVDKMFVVRAVAISKDGNKSNIITKNYFIGNNQYKNKKIISLVTDSYNLVDEEYGIYVKGKAYNDYVASGSEGKAPKYNWDLEGRTSERDCNLTYLNQGNIVLNQDCGMRIHGYGGRSILYKSFNIYARSNYGQKYFANPLFDDTTLTKSFILKYDRYSPSNERFRDGFIQSLVSERDITTQKYEQCIVFLNGEYWQEYSMMQKYSDDYLTSEYGVNKDNITIIKDDKLDVGDSQGYEDYERLKLFVSTSDFSNDYNYNRFCSLVDVDSFIDFYAIQLYINNFDFSYRKNYLLWKTNEKENDSYGDTKWRFMLYDLDYVATDVTLKKDEETVVYNYEFNPFTGNFLYATDFKDDVFFHRLMKNDDFKEKFIMSFFDIANYYLNYDVVKERAYSEYKISSGKLNTFFKNRFTYIKNHLAEYLKINNEVVNVKLQTTKDVQFNTLKLNTNFEGQYFKSRKIILSNVELKDCSLFDLEVVDIVNGNIYLQIIGANPKIIIN